MNQSEILSADLLIWGGDILTVDRDNSSAEAVAVRNGRIVHVGDRAGAERLRGAETQIVDLEGTTLAPGFVEPHSHPFNAIDRSGPTVSVRPTNVPTHAAVMQLMRRRIAKAESGEFLHFFGLAPHMQKDIRPPTIEELDEIAPDNPVVVQINAHVAYANSAAFRRKGWDSATPDPQGGEIERRADGSLTGRVLERAAQALIRPMIDERLADTEFVLGVFEEWLWKQAHAGVTTLGDLGMLPDYFGHYSAYATRSLAPVRVRAYEVVNNERRTVAEPGAGSDTFRIIGVKLWADGSPFVGNVFASRPYLNTDVTIKGLGLPRDSLGHLAYEDDDMTAIIRSYSERGWQIAAHTQGDLAIDAVLDRYEDVLVRRDDAPRFRLEHCAMMRDDQIERAMRLGIICSFFPAHLYLWGEPIADSLFGEDVAARYMPIGSAAKAGMRLSLHCDSPMTEPSPLLCMQVAATRKTANGRILGPDQCIPVEQALRAVTIDAAYALFLEDEIGSIEESKAADFVVLAENPLKSAPDRIGDIAVLSTWRSGQQVFKKDRAVAE